MHWFGKTDKEIGQPANVGSPENIS